MRRILICLTRPKLGDFLMATPLLAGLRDAFPEAHLTGLLWPPDPGEWLTQHRLLDSILWDDRRGADAGPGGVLRLLRRLRQEHYDVLIDLRDRSRYAWLSRLAGIPIRIGSTKKYYGRFLTHNLRQERDTPDRHEIAYNYDMARPLGLCGQPGPMLLPLTASDHAAADQRLVGLNLHDGERFVVINPTHGGSSRSWPAGRFEEVARSIAEETAACIVITGGEEHREENRAIARALAPHALDLTGQTTVPQLGAILQRAALHLSVDTGTMHLAAAMGTPCVTLFPFQEHWEQRVRWEPWKTSFRLVGPAMRCPGCLPGRCLRTQTLCVDSITPGAVVSAALELLRP